MATGGLLAAFAPPSGAAVPAALPRGAATAQVGGRSSARLVLTTAGGAERAAATSTSGAVTFLDAYQIKGTVSGVDIKVTQGSTTIGTLMDLPAAEYTAPQILPAGSYEITEYETGTTTPLASAAVTVTGGHDESEVLYGDPASTTPVLGTFYDDVTSTPAGANVIDFRNAATIGPVDVYLNGVKVATALGESASVAVTTTAESQQIEMFKTGTTTDPVLSTTFDSTEDNYLGFYLVDDPSFAQGVAYEATGSELGYQFVASDGGVFNFGSFPFLGSEGGLVLNEPVVGAAASPTGLGYWLVASDGGVFSHGVPFLGSLGATKLNAPIIGMASTVGPNKQPGYILVAADGGVFTYNASFYGSLGDDKLTSPVVGVTADPTSGRYTLAEADGSVTTFGPGITTPVTSPALTLNAPIVGIAGTPDGGGAWLVGADGGVFTAGDATFLGSEGGVRLNQPVVGIASSFDGLGYTLIARDGGVFTFGDSGFYGSTGGIHLNEPVVGGIGGGL